MLHVYLLKKNIETNYDSKKPWNTNNQKPGKVPRQEQRIYIPISEMKVINEPVEFYLLIKK